MHIFRILKKAAFDGLCLAKTSYTRKMSNLPKT